MHKTKEMLNGQSDRNAIRLLPGEVGLRGDRATFHLGGRCLSAVTSTTTNQQLSLDENGRPTGSLYYNMRPPVMSMPPGMKYQQHLQQHKNLVKVLPSMPVSNEQNVGPVTGMPISDDEHVFMVRLGKQYDDSDDKARLQIEVRLPKQNRPTKTNADTQFLEADVPQNNKPKAASKKSKKNKIKKLDKKAAKKGMN